MQVEVDCEMHANQFWWAWHLFGFGDYVSFCQTPSKTAKISLQTMDYSPWGSKNVESPQKIHASRG